MTVINDLTRNSAQPSRPVRKAVARATHNNCVSSPISHTSNTLWSPRDRNRSSRRVPLLAGWSRNGYRQHGDLHTSRQIAGNQRKMGHHTVLFSEPTGRSSKRSRKPLPNLSARRVVTAVAIAATAALALPATASAAPAPAPTPKVNEATLQSLGAFVPAIIGSAATPGPDGKVNAELMANAKTLAADSGLPPDLAMIWDRVISFLEGTGGGGPAIPSGPGAPVIQQFLYPTLGNGCIPGGNSVGTALATAGPQQAPAPGPARGEAGFVYTSLGTGPALNNNEAPLTVAWVNIDTGKTGQQSLQRNEKINVAEGPGTFTTTAKTGKGRVISAIYGNVTTKTEGKVVSCTIIPTVGLVNI